MSEVQGTLPPHKLVVNELVRAFPGLVSDNQKDIDYEALILGALCSNPALADILRKAAQEAEKFTFNGKEYNIADILNITSILSSEDQSTTNLLTIRSEETGISIEKIDQNDTKNLSKSLQKQIVQQQSFQAACISIFSTWYALEDDIEEEMLIMALKSIENTFGDQLGRIATTAANQAQENAKVNRPATSMATNNAEIVGAYRIAAAVKG
jgi:hypothetical protein